MPAIMFQGTGSNVGKSLLVAGMCRLLSRRGLTVAPFKPQNMSNNAAVTSDGGEIGRAQALQARAAGMALHTDMNPVLLKPESETGSQIVVNGRRWGTAKAREYGRIKHQLLDPVMASFARLSERTDMVIVEGAGSPAEINLRAGDIANMGFAVAGNVPVILVGDIDRGGVIAQLVGSYHLLDKDDEALIEGFIINKFRGDVSLFDEGYREIEHRTGWAGYGVLPYFAESWRLPAEDGLDLPQSSGEGDIHIVCLRLSRIANFDDMDPLIAEQGVRVTMLAAGQTIPVDADLVIIPGSKSTIADMQFIRDQGWDIDLAAHIRRGKYVLGICGGYQMLGSQIDDPDGIESSQPSISGLGFLDVRTVMTEQKKLVQTKARHLPSQLSLEGYEMHIGRTEGPDCQRPFAEIEGRSEGAISPSGRVMGSYLHGLFSDDMFRRHILNMLGPHIQSQNLSYEAQIDQTLDGLAQHLETHLDIEAMIEIAR